MPTRAHTRRLSTGHEVTLPLEAVASIGGVVLPARHTALTRVLPPGLSALPIAPGVGCVTLASIQYHRVGRATATTSNTSPTEGTFEPYNEFAVLIATAHEDSQRGSLSARLFGGAVGGYVHWLPVTTDASVALGREVWGYPKERTEISVQTGTNGCLAVVGDEPNPLTLEVPRPFSLRRAAGSLSAEQPRRTLRTHSYTTLEGELLRTPIELDGHMTVRPPTGTTLEFGDATGTAVCRELGIWNRPLARLYGSRVTASIGVGEPVGTVTK